MFIFKDASGRTTLEFFNKIDGRLRALIYDLDGYVDRTFNKKLIITCLNRTEEENKADKGKPYSAHLFGRAVDIRAKDPVTNRWYFNPEQQEQIKDYLEKTWGKDFISVNIDPHGTAPHIHININYAERNTWV
jgi:hypothetical protein